MGRHPRRTDGPTWFPPPPDPTTAGTYAVVDVETTGFSPGRGDRIIEIGVVLTDGSGSVDYEWVTLLDPGHDPGPTRVHGITGPMLVGAPSFAEVAGDLGRLLSGRILVAHNARFDVSFLDAEWRRLGRQEHFGYLCTMTAARHLGLPASLSKCCEHLGIAMGNAHSALDDALAAANVLARLDPSCCGMPDPLTLGDADGDWSGFTLRRQGRDRENR